MNDTLESDVKNLLALADLDRRKSSFRPGLSGEEARLYQLVVEQLRLHCHTPSIPQLAEILGIPLQHAFDVTYNLIRRGWLKPQSDRPREPWHVSRWRGRYLPSLEAAAFPHLGELVAIALAAAELKEKPTWKWTLDVRSLRSRAEPVISAIAQRACHPVYSRRHRPAPV